jgi:ArsR family transcriptional regulator
VTLQLLQIETPVDAAELLEAFKVLSDPRRFRIMRSLMRAELCVCEIVDELGVPQSLASHHLRVLRHAGLVRARRDAQWVYYSVNPLKLGGLVRAFGALFDPANLGPAAQWGASRSCVGVERDPAAGRCCARHVHRTAEGRPS